MKRIFLLAMVFLVSSDQAWAQDGWYIGTDLGIMIAPGMNVNGTDNDWSTKCDLITNPTQAEIGDGCTSAPPPTSWANEVDGGRGILAALAVGYRRGHLRIEGEYFYQTTSYDDYSPTRIGDEETLTKADQELEIADGGVDDLLAHNFFGNLYYDFAPNSRITPYVGVGAGVARVSLDYFSRWKRNDDPDQITTFRDPVLKARIAGTTTIGMAKLSDTLLAYQAVAGVDYQVSERITMGFKVRWVNFGEFEDGAEWDQLRSHESTVGRDFRVRYVATTDDISFWGISFNTKYQF